LLNLKIIRYKLDKNLKKQKYTIIVVMSAELSNKITEL